MGPAALDAAARAWRALAHPLRRRLAGLGSTRFVVGVSVLLTDPAGRVLVLEHRFWGRYRWGLPSGTARRSETPAEAAAREVREETGLEVTIGPQLETSCRGRRLEVVLSGSVGAGGRLRLQRREILDGRFADAGDLPENLLPSHRRVIERHLGRTGERPG